MKKPSKSEAREEIQKFFIDIESRSPKQVKKIKKLSMRCKLSLKEKRKSFCKKCLTPYKNPRIRIKNKMKSIICVACGYTSRCKIKTS